MNPDNINIAYRMNNLSRIQRIMVFGLSEGTQDYTIALAEENERLRQANNQLQEELDQLKKHSNLLLPRKKHSQKC